MQQIMVTGSNRGIGLAVVAEYLATDDDVVIYACCRHPEAADGLQKLQNDYPDQLMIVPLEVTKQASIEAAFEQIHAKTASLDVLINNAGIDPPNQTLKTITAETMLDTYAVNTVAPLMISQAFLPLLKSGSKLIHISTSMASLSERTYGGNYGYCSSKAALNMMMRGLASDLRSHHITTIALDPGWARTDMGGQSAAISPEESAQGIVSVISSLTMDDNGRYLRYDGLESAW
ncbi:MAG: SDR family oxidoreductase [Phototrophicaceae bacterium]